MRLLDKPKFINLFRFLFFVCLICVQILSLIPTSPKFIEDSRDKLNHLVAFATLFVLLRLAFTRLKSSGVFLLLLLYGVQIELIQIFCENRYFSFLDILADIIGIIIGIVAVKFIR